MVSKGGSSLLFLCRPLPRFHPRTRLHMHADNRLAQRAQIFKAGVAKFQAQLVFGLGTKRPVAFIAGRKLRPLPLFFNMNFWINFQGNHDVPPRIGKCTPRASLLCSFSLEQKDLFYESIAAARIYPSLSPEPANPLEWGDPAPAFLPRKASHRFQPSRMVVLGPLLIGRIRSSIALTSASVWAKTLPCAIPFVR